MHVNVIAFTSLCLSFGVCSYFYTDACNFFLRCFGCCPTLFLEFHSSWHSSDELLCHLSFFMLPELLGVFFLPSLHAAQNFNCFSFSFICSAAANWSNKNRFEERRDQKVPQTSCNEEFAFKNPILFVIQLKQPFSAVFVGLFILSCQFFFLSTPVLNWALRRCYCCRYLLLEIEHLHSDEREKRFTAVYSHTSSTVHVLIVYYFAFQMESISRKFVKMWCGKLIMMMAAANSTHSSSIEA